MKKITYKEYIERARETFELDIEEAKLEFAMELARLLERNDISKTDLANKLGVSAPMVTKILRGDTNLTIETMVKAVRAAKGKLHIHAACENAIYHWREIAKSTFEVSQIRPVINFPHINMQSWEIAANDNENEPVAA